MILAQVDELATALFPVRVPEASEAMTPEESASYAAWQATPIGHGLYAALAMHVARRLGISRGRVISVGDGEGLFARELARCLPEVTIVGSDLCPEVVARARAKHRAANLSYEVAAARDIERLGPADAVVSVFSFHHFEDPHGAVAAMTRALGPGGILYVQDLRRDAAAGAYFRVLDLQLAAAPILARLFRDSVQAAYTAPELREILLAQAGEGEVEVRGVRLDERAWERFRSIDPDADAKLPVLRANVEGLWIEGLVRLPEARPTPRELAAVSAG